MRNTFLFVFFISALILSISFSICIFEAYGYDEGTINTSSAHAKHEIIGYITYLGRYVGDNLFNESELFSSIIIQFSIIIDAFLISVIVMVVNLIIGRIKTAC